MDNTNHLDEVRNLQILTPASNDAKIRNREEVLIKEIEEQTSYSSKLFDNNINERRRKLSSGEKSHEMFRNIKRSISDGCFEENRTKNELDNSDAVQNKRLKIDNGGCHNVEAHANVIATHYNTIEDKGLHERLNSRIFYMRNFNNWIKSMLINEYLSKVKEVMKPDSPIRVMDMCCGKGGDLLKWHKGNISYLICTDIASVSLQHCKARYEEMCARNTREDTARIYKAEFITADSTKVRLRERYTDSSIRLDLVSCQFAFHYCFESLAQAECMLRNAAECLQPGGYFIGTISDANVILARQRKAKCRTFGNDIYQITFECDTDLPPLFGAKYNFHLDGVVDCPEFLVHFPTFVKLARKFGLQLVRKESFPNVYLRMKSEGCSLLQKMQCLEIYPPFSGTPLLGALDDYSHVSNFKYEEKIGTLSKSEWQVASLYLTFAFKKAKTTQDANGKLQYEFA